MLTERELQISPIVQESVVHNTKVRPVLHAVLSRSPHYLCAAFPQLLYLPTPRLLCRLRTSRALLRHAQRGPVVSPKRHRPHVSRDSLHSRKLSLLSNPKTLYSSSISTILFQLYL